MEKENGTALANSGTAKTPETGNPQNGKPVTNDKEALKMIQDYAFSIGYTIEATATYPQSCMALKLYNPEIINDVLVYVQKGIVVKKIAP